MRRLLDGLLLCPGFACGDPGRHLIVVVGDVILGDVVGGGVPHAIVAENIAQRLVEMLMAAST